MSAPNRWLRAGALQCALMSMAAVLALTVLAPGSARARLSVTNNTPFPASKLIVGARWTSRRYDPPSNQRGDILPTVWADDGDLYTMMDDGGTDIGLLGGVWRHSLARITGAPPALKFHHVGNPSRPPPHTWAQIVQDRNVWQGPLGPYYSSGLVAVKGIFYATQERNWSWGSDGLFTGLHGIAYSEDHGQRWRFANQAFPAQLGNLNWVIRGGRGGSYPDGYVYAIATEREYNATKLIMGRSRTGVANITDPSHWQWVSGWTGFAGTGYPTWTGTVAQAVPVASWAAHITYPQMSYDAPLHRYLLSFSYSYSSRRPDVWAGGAELVILEAPHPWGPFSFVARERMFGPANGYDPGFPTKWISANGRDLWLKWAANWDGCNRGLDCSGAYGFNLRRVHMTIAGDR